jgi:hypothetical protein
VIVIIGPPPSVAYPFILDVEGYPLQIIYFFIAVVSFCLFLWDAYGDLRPSFDSLGSFLAKMEEAKC